MKCQAQSGGSCGALSTSSCCGARKQRAQAVSTRLSAQQQDSVVAGCRCLWAWRWRALKPSAPLFPAASGSTTHAAAMHPPARSSLQTRGARLHTPPAPPQLAWSCSRPRGGAGSRAAPPAPPPPPGACSPAGHRGQGRGAGTCEMRGRGTDERQARSAGLWVLGRTSCSASATPIVDADAVTCLRAARTTAREVRRPVHAASIREARGARAAL